VLDIAAPFFVIMFLFSASVGSLSSRQAESSLQSPESEGESDLRSIADIPSDDTSTTPSAMRDAKNEPSVSDSGESMSCGGTIIASLSSREVARNHLASQVASRAFAPQRATEDTNHPCLDRRIRLSDVATISSRDALSFTPTMAEKDFSLPETPKQASLASNAPRQQSLNPRHPGEPFTPSEDMSTFDITHLHPDLITCPFCDREKDLRWQLTREQEHSHDFKVAESKTRFLLVAALLMFLVSFISFFIGKTVSDLQSQEVISQYMAQCSEMVSQKDDDELYWKLVNAAFSAMVNAMEGPLANVVLGIGSK